MAAVCRVPTAHRGHAGSGLVIVLLALLVSGCFGSMNRDDLRQEIRVALRDDPQLVLDALRGREVELIQLVDNGAQDREVFSKQKQRLAELANPYQPTFEGNRPVRGPASAPITIVEYADFECPFCAHAHHTVQQILKRYDGQVRFLYKHNPIDQIHPKADPTARWFEAIAKQSHEKAWAFHDRLYETPDLVKQGETAIDSLVASLGLDAEQVRCDFNSEEITAQVQRDRKEAMSFGFQGTPAFLINGVSLRGAYPLDEFVQVIELVKERETGLNV